MKKIQYDRILKDCFGILNLSENDIKEIIQGDDERKKWCFLKNSFK